MNFNEYDIKFRELANRKGFAKDYIEKCLNYARPLLQQNLPVIFNTTHFSLLVGYQKNYIKRVCKRPSFFYRNFEVSKKNGSTRVINEPLPSLKEIQQWILNNILYEMPVSRFAKAYIPNKNILDNVKFHRGYSKIITLDIKSFFPSIKREKIEIIFKEIGYSKIIANLLSKICCLDDSLPEGASTSPYLSNIILRNYDRKIADYCIKNKIRYTRYADDLTFSGNKFDEKELIEFVEFNLKIEGLTLNKNKTKIMLSHQRQIITGVVVNKKIQVNKLKRKELRQAIYYINKFGLKDHLRKINCQKQNYLKHLLGISQYILFINPNDKEVTYYKQLLEKWIDEENDNIYKDNINFILEQGYISEWKSDFQIIKELIPNGIICLLSAASYYDLTTFIPSKHYVVIPHKDKAHLPNYPPIELFYWENANYNLGIVEIEIEDVQVSIYDVEKTVCDVIKYHKEIGKNLALEILKNYLKREDRNITKLINYARQLSIYKNPMSDWMETLLV
jgi:RNA-directed DNA polymerase